MRARITATSIATTFTLLCFVVDHRNSWKRSTGFVSAASGKKTSGRGVRWRCDENDRKNADILVAKMLTIGRDDRRFPESVSQMKTFCKEVVSMQNRLESYKEACLRESAKQMVSLLIYTLRANQNLYCKKFNSRRTQDMIAAGKCANAASKDWYQCVRNYNEQLCALWDLTDGKRKLAQMCCGFERYFGCLRSVTSRHSECDEKSIETLMNFVRAVIESAVNFMCADYLEPSDKCDNYKFVPLEPPTEKTKKHPKYENYQSFFNPLMHVLTNL